MTDWFKGLKLCENLIKKGYRKLDLCQYKAFELWHEDKELKEGFSDCIEHYERIGKL